jgi:2-dehydro-3-deoxyphosphooctonate aldolase (KDO 8-P synthase)
MMALAAKAFGANGYFLEVHPTPDTAMSDAANTVHLAQLEEIITSVL